MARALRRYLRTSVDEPLSGATAGRSRELPPNPYKGLEAYTESDTDLFFGRDEQIERLWSAFRELHKEASVESGTPRVLPIVGPSGCGKSSLVRAGLIAEMRRRPFAGREEAQFVVFAPGAYPLESLALALARLVTGEPSPLAKANEFEERLKALGNSGFRDGIRRIADLLPDPRKCIVLVIDQFEELYSLCGDAEVRRIFIESLLHAAADRQGRVSVVLTLRSDFLGQTQDDSEFNGLVSERLLMVPAMSESELRAAISQPAQRAGHPLDESVIALLVNETQGRDGALPLLQFTLSRIWEGLRGGRQPADVLREIGGVGGALAGEAQRIFDELTTDDQRIARRAF
jgi:hypothetical protein